MTDAIVLREQPIEEFDSILTLLTKERGVISAYARGARKRSAARASMELLSCACFVLFSNREKYSVDKADLNRLFMGVRSDMEKLALASYFCELTAEAAPREEESGEYLSLLLNTLHLLDRGKRTCEQVKPVYELRFMTLAGFMPDLVGCKNCRSFEAERMFFIPLASELLCGACGGESVQGHVELSRGVLAAMRHILYSEHDKLFSFTLSPSGFRYLNTVTEHYVMTQLDKRFPTFEFYESVRL